MANGFMVHGNLVKEARAKGKRVWFPGMGEGIKMDTLKKRAVKFSRAYEGVYTTKRVTTEKPIVVRVTGNDELDDLTKHFGHALADRIYACAVIQLVKMQEKASEQAEGEEEGGELTITDALRYTVGMVKRMRLQAIEHGRNQSWTNAVDRLENEQVEQRHYTFRSKAARETARIEKVNTQKHKECEWSAMIEIEAERIEASITEKATDASDVALWVTSYMNGLTAKRRSWLGAVLAGFRRGAELTTRQRQAISNRYAPEGVKPVEFVELLTRYA